MGDVMCVFGGFGFGDVRVEGLRVELVEGPEVHDGFVGGFEGGVCHAVVVVEGGGIGGVGGRV